MFLNKISQPIINYVLKKITKTRQNLAYNYKIGKDCHFYKQEQLLQF